jgi:hypothetical protein
LICSLFFSFSSPIFCSCRVLFLWTSTQQGLWQRPALLMVLFGLHFIIFLSSSIFFLVSWPHC